jgi:tight adherence protein B
VIAAFVCGGLVALAILVETSPAPGPKVLVESDRARVSVRRRRRWGRAARRARTPDVAGLMTEVAARLRAGAPVHAAWARAFDRAGLEAGVLGRPDAAGPLAGQLAAVRAAVGLAERLGAPLADVLDRCALGVAAAGRAESARRVALAGPASTARLLSALPVLGVLVGTALGADPLESLLDGGPGTAAAMAGLGLLVLGHRWTSVLVATARRAGSDEAGR